MVKKMAKKQWRIDGAFFIFQSFGRLRVLVALASGFSSLQSSFFACWSTSSLNR